MAESTTSVHLFAPIEAPRLKSISRKAIQHFLAERSQYEAAVKAQPGINAISWAGCFDAIFLRSLIRARIFGADVKEETDLTDKIIKKKLLELSGASKSVSFEEALADVKRNCRLDASEPDAKLRILMLKTSYIELCERRGWKFYENAQKAAIKQICALLQPPELKNRVRDALQLEKNYLEDDFFAFMEYLAEEAAVCERFKPLRSYLASNKIGRNKASDSKEGYSFYHGSSSNNTKSKEKPACLNKKCNGKHFIKDCPISSETEKDRFLKELRETRNKSQDATADSSSRREAKFSNLHHELKDEKFSSPFADLNLSEPSVILAN